MRRGEIDRLWTALKKDPSDQTMRNRIMEIYLPLVKLHARKLWARLPRTVELDDLCSAGVFGLLDAIEKFEPAQKIRFETYCAPRIRGAMLDELRAMDWVPRLTRQRAEKLRATIARLEARLGRSPTEEETAAELGLSPDQLEEFCRSAHVVALVSLDSERCESDARVDQTASLHGVMAATKDIDTRMPGQRRDLFRLVASYLSRTERLLLFAYYYEGRTMAEIGASIGLCESRIRQMHDGIILRLRSRLAGMEGEFDFR
jgi:RNA polymerase sigma factor for flagellar operon FliA